MMKPYLKPCPYCGEYNIEILYGRDRNVYDEYAPDREASVRCMHCGIGTRLHSRAEISVRKWNRRVGDY